MRCHQTSTLGIAVVLIAIALFIGCDEGVPMQTDAPSLAVDSLEACCPPGLVKGGADASAGVVAASQPSESNVAQSQPATGGSHDDTDRAASGASGGWRAGPWLEPADRDVFYLDFAVTDQDGRELNLQDLVGKPIALTFIFTRCPSPDMCPLMTATMAGLQERVEQAGLSDRVRLVMMTYDPTYDTPARLKAYGAGRGLQFTNALMLRPDPDRFRELIDELRIGVSYNADGSIGHFIELLLIDSDGRYVRDYQGAIWGNEAVLADLKRLDAERRSAQVGG